MIVGLDPGLGTGRPIDPDRPTGRRMASLSGLDRPAFSDRFDRINLHPEPRPSSDDQAAGRNLSSVVEGRRVVALGRRVAAAVGCPSEWMEWSVRPGGFVGATMPHPSGLSRWWNDPGNRTAAGEFASRATRPTVYVEGVDGSGKTILAEWLSETMKVPLIPTDDRPGSWDECLSRIVRRVVPGVVCDRSSGLVSELVYGPVLRGGTIVDESVLWDTVRAVRGSGVWVYCRPPVASLRPRTRPGEDRDHVRSVEKNLVVLSDRYDEVMSRMVRIGCQVVRYDRTSQGPEEVLRCVE